MPEQGDIVLIPVPFTDLSSQKRRPVIVISNNSYNLKTADMIVVAMTSNPQAVDYSFALTSSDLEKGALNRPGKVRVDKIYTLSQAIVAKSFGRVNAATLDHIRETLKELVAKKSQPKGLTSRPRTQVGNPAAHDESVSNNASCHHR